MRFAMDNRRLGRIAWFSNVIVIVLLLADVVVNLIRPIYYEVLIALASLLIFILVQFFLERLTRLRNPPITQIGISLLVFIGVCVGRFFFLYQNLPGFDKFMHFLYGAAFGACGFILFYLLNPGQKSDLTVKPAAVALFAVGFTLACSFAWEMFEFVFDRLFNTNMQNWKQSLTHGVTDVMLDQLADFAGGMLAGIFGSRSLRRRPRDFYQRYIADILANWPGHKKEDNNAQQNR